MSVIVSGFFVVAKGLNRIGVAELLMRPVKKDFANAYKYGHPKAQGFDEGGAKFHPRVADGGASNFRLFINPNIQKGQ